MTSAPKSAAACCRDAASSSSTAGEEQNPVVFAMSTSYMLVAFAGILALVFLIFQFLSRRTGAGARAGLGRRPPPSLAGDNLHRYGILKSGARHLRGSSAARGRRGQRRSCCAAFSDRYQAQPHRTSTSSIGWCSIRRSLPCSASRRSHARCMSGMSMPMRPTFCWRC